MALRRLISVGPGPLGCQVSNEDGSLETGQLVVDDDGVVRWDSPEQASKSPAPEGSRAEGEEVGTPEADPTG